MIKEINSALRFFKYSLNITRLLWIIFGIKLLIFYIDPTWENEKSIEKILSYIFILIIINLIPKATDKQIEAFPFHYRKFRNGDKLILPFLKLMFILMIIFDIQRLIIIIMEYTAL